MFDAIWLQNLNTGERTSLPVSHVSAEDVSAMEIMLNSESFQTSASGSQEVLVCHEEANGWASSDIFSLDGRPLMTLSVAWTEAGKAEQSFVLEAIVSRLGGVMAATDFQADAMPLCSRLFYPASEKWDAALREIAPVLAVAHVRRGVACGASGL